MLNSFKLVLFFLLLSLCNFTVSAQTITLNTTGQPPLNTPELDGFMDLISKEAFKRIGFTLNTVKLPAERGLKNADAGIEDGEMSRVAGLDKKYKNLIQVPEKIMDWHFVAFGPETISVKNGWNDLAPYSLAYINGWKILEVNANFPGVVKVRNSEQLFTLVKKKRVDAIIYERWGGLLSLSKQNLPQMKLLEPPLANKSMYIYLHKKHKNLVSPLATALSDMKNDGTYQKIFNDTLSTLNH